MAVRMTIFTPDKETFDNYYYGYGRVLFWEMMDRNGRKVCKTVVDYGDDKYRANYQLDRFASGLHFGTVEEA